MVKRLIVDFGRSNEGSRRGRWEMTSFDLAVIVRMGGRVGERVGGAGLGEWECGSESESESESGGMKEREVVTRLKIINERSSFICESS